MSLGRAAPSAEQQLAFLTKLQRLFAEGDFTATYKFALLVAMADLAVECGTDDDAELVLSTRQIATRFIQLYWRHASPYGTGHPGSAPGILVQNVGAQAAVLTAIAAFRAQSPATSAEHGAALPAYGRLVSKVATTVSAQPLNYLQNFGGDTDPFLFVRDHRGRIRLKPGVAYCLRRFYPLVQQLARSHWVDHIKTNRRNHAILGEAGDLEEFLFCASRQSLALVAAGLRKLDGDRCFYCDEKLSGAEVDHYLPFSLYPRDLAHNFVLAHPSCNRSKSDTLAAKPHLERWLDRMERRAADLSEIGLIAGITADIQVTRRVIAWGYSSAVANAAHAWIEPSRYERMGADYLALL